ncbi:MAG: GNAT family N-acetyltransferase [Micromonosporaceae bacterium]
MSQTQPLIRIARPHDAEAVRRFLTGLSPHAQYLRFFQELGSVPAGMIRHLVAMSPRQLALLAWDGDEVVGHAMAACAGRPHAVDIAVVVADAYRGAGLGDRLIRDLVDIVSRYGAAEVHSDVLTGNHLVLDWMRRRLPGVRFEPDGATVAAHGQLTSPAA